MKSRDFSSIRLPLGPPDVLGGKCIPEGATGYVSKHRWN